MNKTTRWLLSGPDLALAWLLFGVFLGMARLHAYWCLKERVTKLFNLVWWYRWLPYGVWKLKGKWYSRRPAKWEDY